MTLLNFFLANKITILTSSRADYSIYKPLLQELYNEPEIELQIVAFGTHTSMDFGFTVQTIKDDGFLVFRELPFVLDGSGPCAVSTSISKTIEQFSNLWNNTATDLIVCLGDRYEMFAAVTASVPFQIPVLHIHGGETTLGAMDNVFRNCLTHMASIHFACCEKYRKKIVELTGAEKNIYNTGALSIDNLSSLQLLTVDEFNQQFKVNLSKPTILTTFHPETVSFENNEMYAQQLVKALEEIIPEFQVLITMPNVDTFGNIIRNEIVGLQKRYPEHIFTFENLGTIGYLSAMKHCSMMVGNTSSGFIEASFFPKWVINLGNRQDGRLITENIITVPVVATEIVKSVHDLKNMQVPEISHPYGDGKAAIKMKSLIYSYLQTPIS